MSFSSINWCVIILKWLESIQLFTFATFTTLILSPAVVPSKKVMPSFWKETPSWICRSDCSCLQSFSTQHQHFFSWLCQVLLCGPGSRKWRDNTSKQRTHPCSFLAYAWRRLTAPAQAETLLAKVMLAGWKNHCHAVQDQHELVRKKRNRNCKTNAARLSNLFYPTKSNRSSVCLARAPARATSVRHL